MTGFVSNQLVAVAMSGGDDSAVTAATSTPERLARVRVNFRTPQRASAPGQVAVFCDRSTPDRLIGSGRIVRDAGAQHG